MLDFSSQIIVQQSDAIASDTTCKDKLATTRKSTEQRRASMHQIRGLPRRMQLRLQARRTR